MVDFPWFSCLFFLGGNNSHYAKGMALWKVCFHQGFSPLEWGGLEIQKNLAKNRVKQTPLFWRVQSLILRVSVLFRNPWYPKWYRSVKLGPNLVSKLDKYISRDFWCGNQSRQLFTPSAPVIPCEAKCTQNLTHNPKPRLQKGAVSMIGVYNHLLSKVFMFHYHSQFRWARILRESRQPVHKWLIVGLGPGGLGFLRGFQESKPPKPQTNSLNH